MSGLVSTQRGLPGTGYQATSATSLVTAGSGSKSFTTQLRLAYSVGARVRATSRGTSEWMEGVVTAYSGGVLTITADKNSGTGTHADWDLNLAGEPGSTGSAGPGYAATSATSLTTAGSGSKSFTTQAGLAYTVGARIRATSTGSGDWMEGLVTSYSSTTLVVTMDLNSGTGTRTDWTINVAGQRGATGSTGPGYAATSATSLTTAGSGSKSFTTQSGLAYTVGARIRATSTGSGDWMEGLVTSYSSTTLVVTMDLNSGTGTRTDWDINLAGQRGATGVGSTGPGYAATSSTSLTTAGSGSFSFTTQAGLAYSVGARIRASSTGSGDWMEGVVTSYSSTTLVATMDLNSGTGTNADWNINVAGENTGATGAAGPGYAATSATSLACAGSGSKVFTTQAGLAYTVGARIRATSTGSGDWMEGLVTAYSGTTLTVTMDLNSGTGTRTDWDINLAGNPGAGAGSTTVTALAHASAGGTMVNGADTIIDFDTIGTNYGTMITRPGSVFTCTLPTTRPYRVNADAVLNANGYTVGNVMTLLVYKNGSALATLDRWTAQSTTSQNLHLKGTLLFDGTAADVIDVRVGNSSGGNLDISTNALYTHFGITGE